MKFLSFIISLLVVSAGAREIKISSHEVTQLQGSNRALTCDQCKLLVGTLETIDICPFLPEQFQDACDSILPEVINTYTPEVICQKMDICTNDHLLLG